MINTDNNIREIFSQKLGNIEADVPDLLWENISQNLPSGSSVGGSSVAVKTIISKIWIAAGIAAAVVSGVVIWQKFSPVRPTTKTEQPIKESNSEAKSESLTTEQSEKTLEKNLTEEISDVANVHQENNKVKETLQKDHNTNSAPSASIEERIITPSVPAQHENISNDKPHKNEYKNSTTSQAASSNNDEQKLEFTAEFSFSAISENSLEYNFVANNACAQNYLWTFDDGTNQQGKLANKQFSEEGKYRVTLTVTANDGTQMSTESVINVFKSADFFIPNVFTPNNDGQNDVFDPQEKSSNLEITKVIILDDKGKVFESQGEKNWDGNDPQGNPCPAGNYYFLVRATDRNHQILEKTGSIRLIR